MNETQPVRLQRSRKKGSSLSSESKLINNLDYVYVGRGSRWGNPFRVVQYSDKKYAIKTDGSERCGDILVKHCHAVYDTKEEAVIDAIKCYDFWLVPCTHKDSTMMEFYSAMAEIDDALLTLKGKNLVCWCGLSENCHGDLLLKLANK